MNTMETERTIDLRILFFRVLKRWRLLLLFLVLGVLLGAAFGFLQVRKAAKNSSKAVQEYNAKKAECDQAVKEARDALEDYEVYLNGTLISQLDPNSVPTSESRLFVSAVATDESSPNASAIVSNGIRYILFDIDSSLESTECFSKISELTGTEDRFLRELITITTNSSSGIIDIVVNYTNLETSEAIQKLIVDYAMEVSKDLKPEGIASYKVEVFKGYSGMAVNSTINTTKSNFPKNLATLKTNLATAESARDALSAPKSYGRKAKLIEIMKYGVLFGAALFLLGAVLIALKLLFPRKILSAGDAELRFRLPVFADYGSLTARHHTRFDRWILRHLEGKTFDLDTDGHSEAVRVASENALQNAEALVLVSTSEDDGPDQIAESLKKALPDLRIEAVKGALKDPALFETLKEGAPAMIVEKLEKARYYAIVTELGFAKSRGAEVKGAIFYE